MLELTSHRELDSFNVGWFDGRTSKLVAPRRRARILDGTPVEDFAISGPLQRRSCTTHPYAFPGGQLKHRARLTVCRRREWASTAVKRRYKNIWTGDSAAEKLARATWDVSCF